MISENILKSNMERAWLKSVLNKTFYAALAIFFFLLPLQTRWIFHEAALYEWGTLSIYVVEVLGWVVIVLGAIKIQEYKNIKIGNSLFLYSCILVFLAFLSVAWAPDKAVALQAAVRLLEGVLLYVIVAAPRGQATAKSGLATSAAGAFLAGALVQASLGIYQFLTQSSFSSTLLGMAQHAPQALGTSAVEFGDERWLRAYGGLPHPNVFGGYLVVALGVLMLLIWRGRASVGSEARPPYIALAIAPVLLTGIFFSFSRAAWLAAGIILIDYYVRIFRPVPYSDDQIQIKGSAQSRTIVRLCAFLIIGYVVLLSASYWPLVRVRIMPQNQERLEVRSRMERAQGAREAWRIIKAHPLVGVGIGNYTQALQRLRPNQPLYAYQPVHNVPLLVFSELGLVGLLLFSAALYTIVRQSKFFILHSSFFILLLLDHYLWTLPFGIFIFWAILGLFTTIHRPRT